MNNAAGLSNIENLAELIEVSPESTVSRAVFRGEGVNVILFAFDTGEGLTEHTAAVPVLVQLLEGEAVVTAEGREVTLKPGGLVHFTAQLPHAVKVTAPSKMALFMLPQK